MKNNWEMSYKIREMVGLPIGPVTSWPLLDGSLWYEEHELYNEAIAEVDKRITAFTQQAKNLGVNFVITEHYAKLVGETHE